VTWAAALQASHPDLVTPTRKVYEWALARDMTPTWGTGAETGSLSLRVSRSAPRVASLFTDGRIEFAFGGLKAPFDDLGRRRELVARFAAIAGFGFPDDAETRYPSVPLALLLDDAVLEQFLGVVDWWANEMAADLTADGSPS
jgi:hypothetical protein